MHINYGLPKLQALDTRHLRHYTVRSPLRTAAQPWQQNSKQTILHYNFQQFLQAIET